MPDDASLVLARRATVAGPGLHAILIGVSDYQFLPPPDEPPGEGLAALQKLASPALSVFRFRQRLEALDGLGGLHRPLKTVRMLVAPSAQETQKEPGLAAVGTLPTFAAIKLALRAWRGDMSESRDAAGIFYFSGHGIRRVLEENILLASDFLDPDDGTLDRAFRLSNIRGGMAPSHAFPDIGRTQFYFIDACRDKPDALDALEDTQTPKIFEADLNTLDDRKAPIFFATYDGGVAAGLPGEETFFYKSIDWALGHASGESVTVDGVETWPITVSSLKLGIERHNPLFDGRLLLTGQAGNPVICFMKDPPTFEMKVSIAPDTMRPAVKRACLIEINRSEEVDLPGTGDPRVVDLRAGLYRLEIEAANSEFSRVKTNAVRLGFDYQMPWQVRVGSAV